MTSNPPVATRLPFLPLNSSLSPVLLALVAVLNNVSCKDQGGPAPASGSSWVHQDLLPRARVERGASGTFLESKRATRGSWTPSSGSGVFEENVLHEGLDRLTTMLRGPKQRTIQVPLPDEFDATHVRILALSKGGGDAHIEAAWIGRTSKALPRQTLDAPNQVTTFLVPLPSVVDPQLLALELTGSAEVIGVMAVEFVRNSGGEQRVEPVLRGPAHDQRRAVALTPGAQLVVDIPLPKGQGPGFEAFDVIAALSAPERGRARIDLGGAKPATWSDAEAAGWRSVRVPVEASAREVRCTVEADADSGEVLLSELRLVSRSAAAPTVVLVTSDTHRGDHLGRFGAGALVRTPILDAVADKGLFFTNCFASTNVTNPSHIALMTGVHVRDTRIANNATALSSRATTLAEVFRANGYRTFGATSVMHLTRVQSGLGQGFDRYDAPFDGKRDGRVAIQRLLDWLPDAKGHPTFVWLHVYDAHAPYDPPQDLIERYWPSGQDPKDPSKSLGGPDDVIAAWIKDPGYRDPDYINARYRAAVDYVDVGLGDLLALPRMQQATLAFTADHGESLGRDGVFWEHSHLNMATMHIPMLLSWPGCKPGVVPAPVEQIDIGRTLLDLAGIRAEFPGQSLLGALEKGAVNEPRFGLASHGWSAAIELNGWLLTLQIVKYPLPIGSYVWEQGEVQLFDLRNDPEGLENVVEREFPRAKKMRAALIKWLQEADPTGLGQAVELSSEARASLDALGYGGGTEGTATGSWWKVPANLPWVERFEGR